MPLTLVTGRANTGKTSRALACLRAAVAGGHVPRLVVPTGPDARRARAWLSTELPVGVDVRQYDHFIRDLWTVYGDGRRLLSATQAYALMREAASRAGGGTCDSAATPGYARFAVRVARRLAEETGPRLEGLRRPPGADGITLDVVRSYVRTLEERGLVEPAAAAWHLAAQVPGPEGPIVFHEFSEFTASQEALLLGLSGIGDVLVALHWERGFPPTRALDATVLRFESSAASVERLPSAGRTDTVDELLRVSDGLFGPPKPVTGGGAVRFCVAEGSEAEAVLVAREAARAVAEVGDPARVAIVLRHAARRADALRIALKGAGLDADFDVRMPVSRTPFGWALTALLEFELSGSHGALSSFLSSPFSGAAAQDVEALEKGWRERRETDVRRLSAGAKRSSAAARTALTLSADVHARPIDTEALPAWKKLADTLIAAAAGCGRTEEAQAAQDAAAHRAVIEAVAEMGEVGGFTCGDLVSALGDVAVAPAATERAGCVQVTEAHRLRARRFDAVVIAGMSADDWSGDADDAASEAAQRLLGTIPADRGDRERLLLYSVLTRARRQLVVVRRGTSSEGSTVRPSIFWEQLLDAYRDPSPESAEDPPRGGVPIVNLSGARLASAAPSVTPGRDRQRAVASRRVEAAQNGSPESVSRAVVVRGVLGDPEVLAEMAERQVFSVTELETYAACPYKWFYERVLRPRRIDGELGVRETGDLAHRTLRRVYRELAASTGRVRVTAETLEQALALTDDVFQKESERSGTPAPTTVAEEEALAATRRHVSDLVAADAEFLPDCEPVAVELAFGGDGTDPLQLDGFALRGCIDRVDAGPRGAVVIDYKSGAAPSLRDIGRKRLLQLPLYGLAAERLVGEPVVAGLYRSLRERSDRGFYVRGACEGAATVSTDGVGSIDEVRCIMDDAVAAARSAVDGIRSGRIRPDVHVPGACGFCAAAPFCPGRR